MSAKRILDPFPGEKIVETVPAIAPFVTDAPLSRLRYFPRRNLTERAFHLEQRVRTARLRLRARGTSPGIVRGLETGIGIDSVGAFVMVGAGYGMADSGEDVLVNRMMRVHFPRLPLFAPFAEPGELPLLQSHPADGRPLVGVLLLQPCFYEEMEVPSATKPEGFEGGIFHPCERVPEDEAYYRRTTVDAARLVYFLWDESWPARWQLPPQTTRWRNEIAWRIFAAEQRGEPAPWLEFGLPIGVLALDPGRLPLFLDHHAAARRGGKPRRRVLASEKLANQLHGTGEPRLWDARIEQFAAHLSEITTVSDAVETFHFLPPLGIVPSAWFEWGTTSIPDTTKAGGTLDLRTVANSFFPSNYALQLAVVPLEQLDAVAKATRGLKHFDLTQPDQAMLLAPVPQRVFDPQLLEIEEVSPEFDDAVAEASARRSHLRAMRDDLQKRHEALATAAYGKNDSRVPRYPAADPGQVDESEAPETGYKTAEPDLFGTTGSGNTVTVTAFEGLRAKLKGFYDSFADTPEISGLTAYYEHHKGLKAAEFSASPDAATKFNEGIVPFLNSLIPRVDDADELIESHYLRVKADVYRLGQLLSGNTLTTRFATSDALASLVQRSPLSADAKGITSFASQLLGGEPKAETPEPNMARKAARATTAGTNATFDSGMFNTPQDLSVNLLSDAEGRISGATLKTETVTSAVKQMLAADKELFRLKEFETQFGVLPFESLRTLKLDRLKPPLSSDIRGEIKTSRNEVFDKLKQFPLCLLGLASRLAEPDTASPTGFKPLLFAKILAEPSDDSDLDDLAAGDNPKATEANHFARGVKHADFGLAAVRAVEGRMGTYREIIQLAQGTLDEVAKQLSAIAARLHGVGEELGEARHDVSLAKSLRDEERQRVEQLNEKRDAVLRDNVSFFVFCRPRALDPRIHRATLAVEPALTESPALAALRENLPLPTDLQAFQEVFRDSPSRWYRFAPKWLLGIDRFEPLRDFVRLAVERSAVSQVRTIRAPSTGRYASALTIVFQGRAAAAAANLNAVRNLSVSALSFASWRDLRRQAEEALTLGQYIDHGPGLLARNAANELENIFKIAAALHRDFSEVPAQIRLVWGETFSQFDAKASFRDLARLPRWEEVGRMNQSGFVLRREMQLLVDWLFSRINAADSGAVELINDLIRVCLLLASHAPVDQLVTGEVAMPVAPIIGGQIRIKVDPARVRLGMGVVVEAGGGQMVRAVVDDITPGEAVARVTSVPAGVGTLPLQQTVRFVEASTRF